MSEILIETHNLVKQYGKFVAVNNVSFEVRAGEVFGFLGPNGAGKTTSIKMIVGLLQATSGTVKVAGYDVQSQGLLAKAASGYVPDTPNLYAKLTGRELLRFVGDLYDVDRQQAAKRIEELLRMFDLADAADETLDSYSHGMQQKASLAAALMHDPKVLILDEPTVGLDPKSARLIKDILRQLADRGAAVMLSTHILEIAERMCDRIGIINKGELVAVGTMDELRGQGHASLEDIFLGLTGGAESAEIAEISQMSLATHIPQRGLLPVVFKLLALRWRINFNSFKRAKVRVKIFMVIGTVAVLAFAGFIFWLSWLLLGYVSSPKLVVYTGIEGGPLMDAIPVTIFTVMFIGILLTSFGVLLQALYLSGDMDFLLAAPVPIRAVFITKLLQAVLPNFGFMALFGLPLLYGMGAARGYNFVFYPLVPIVMVALTLAAAGLSSLLVMLVVRVFPARRIAEVLGFFTAIISILCSQSGNLMNIRRNAGISPGQVNQLVELQARLNNPWFPLNWAGRGLVELGSGNWLPGILLVTLTLALFAGAFWFALVTAERWYYTGWAGMQVVARKKRSVATPPPGTAPRGTVFTMLGRLLPAPTRGIVQKDFMVLRRDLRNLSQLITPLIFGVIYAASFLRNGSSSASDTNVFFRSLLAYSNVGVALFVGWNLLIRLGGMGFSQEGKNYWLLKAAPLRTSHLLTAKFLVAYLPALVMGTAFLLVVSIVQRISFFSFFYSLLVTIFCLAEMAGIMVAFGAAGANLTWDDPRKMNSGVFGCFGMISTVAATAVTFLLFTSPPALMLFLGQPEIYGALGGLLLGGIFSIGLTLAPLWLVRKKVERLGEA